MNKICFNANHYFDGVKRISIPKINLHTFYLFTSSFEHGNDTEGPVDGHVGQETRDDLRGKTKLVILRVHKSSGYEVTEDPEEDSDSSSERGWDEEIGMMIRNDDLW